MAGMARARRDKHNGVPLFTINADAGGESPGGEASQRDAGGESPGAAAALTELRELLAGAGAPADLLEILDGPGTPEEILQELTDSGLLPSSEDSLDGLVGYFAPLLEEGTDQLQAELAGSQFLGMMRQGGAAAEDLPELLGMLAAQAEEYGRPVALAMLRVLSAVAPQARAELTAAAERLVATGLTDPPWVRDLGAPVPGRCFGYRDLLGAQETVAITFRYRRERHAFCVLIDHDLGGGVKDCWPTDQVDQVRTEYEALADPDLMEFREYQPAEAHAILTAALDQPPCPEQPDQVEDVRDYLELLRQRVARLADPAAPVPAPRGSRNGGHAATVHRLKIGLRGAKPPIWRRLEVPSRHTLDDIHGIIQQAFDWEGYHLWVFETPKGRYGVVDPELGHRSAAAVRLDQVAPGGGDRIRYTYDFGDNWEHEIVVEDVLDAEPGVAYPRCLAGRRATPPEDCGGIWGYQYLLEILDDPAHPEHAERLEWLGLASADELDPATFDHAALNRALPAKVLVRS
jgi:hypothetical protein